MCYCKNCLKSSLNNTSLKSTGINWKVYHGALDDSNSECIANLEIVPMLKMCTMTLWDLIQKPTFFLTATPNVFGEKLSQEDETLNFVFTCTTIK